MSNRFQGEAYIQFADGEKELRQIIVLSPYIQTSESLRDIDYSHALVVDAQSMEFDYKTQLYEMANNHEATLYNTFLEYCHKSTFRNGANVLQWLHEKNEIKRVPAHEAYIVIGNGGNAQRFRIDEVNKSIREQNEAKLSEREGSSYSDPSVTDTTVQPAMIEGTKHPEPSQTLTENATVDVNNNAAKADGIDLSKVPGVTLMDESGNPVQPQEAVVQPASQQKSIDVEAFESRLERIESLITKRTKDTVITRLINRYDLTEAEVVKALESAGKRKEKKKQKEEAAKQSG